MGLKDRNKIKKKQAIKRSKKRKRLKDKGLDPDNFYSCGVFVGHNEPAQ